MVTELNSGLYKHTYRGRFSGRVRANTHFAGALQRQRWTKHKPDVSAQTRRLGSLVAKPSAETIGCLKMIENEESAQFHKRNGKHHNPDHAERHNERR